METGMVDGAIQEAAYLVSRGVRPLALLGAIEPDPEAMKAAFVRLNQFAGVERVIPFVIQRRDHPSAQVGYAAASWAIDLLRWSYDNAPLTHHHRIVGLLLGYSVEAIAEHDAREFAGRMFTEPKEVSPESTRRTSDSTCKA